MLEDLAMMIIVVIVVVINDAKNFSFWGQTRWFSWDGNGYDDQDDHQDVHDDNDDDWSNVVCGQTR